MHVVLTRESSGIIYPALYGLLRHFPNLTRFALDRFTPPLEALAQEGTQ